MGKGEVAGGGRDQEGDGAGVGLVAGEGGVKRGPYRPA
jgi:hypothetical protein